MKLRVFAVGLLLLFLFSGCNLSFDKKREEGEKIHEPNTVQTPVPEQMGRQVPVEEEMRGIWISYSELSTVGEKDVKSAFEKKIETMFTKIANYGFNTVFVHVRAFCDAFYPSAIYPWSAYLTGTQGMSPDFDPLAFMLEKAHEKNLKFHAWINPYRISTVTDTAKLAAENPARCWLEKDVYDRRILTSTGLYFNPASEDVRKLIVDGVKEILEHYAVDGIHFDDYFYPQADTFIDQTEYNAYVKKGGKLSQALWRKENVNLLVKEVYQAVKAKDTEVLFGISPSGNIEANQNTLFADVEAWACVEGYVDYLCPQIYYGFENPICPFEKTADAWYELAYNSSVTLYVGLAAYKCGIAESGSKFSEEAKREWAEHEDMLSRQIEYVRKLGKYQGFVMFSYESLFSETAEKNITKELKNITNLL